MSTAWLHFGIGFLAIAGIAFAHARLLGEVNGSFLAAGLVSGVVCASLATFATPWATPLVIGLLGAVSHKEYREARQGGDRNVSGNGPESSVGRGSGLPVESDDR